MAVSMPSRADGGRRLTAFLAALCLFLSAIEYMLPRPVPFMRLGLSNLPLLLAVDLLPFGAYMALALVKVAGMSVLSGSLFSYVAVFSLAGTLASALVMRGVRAVAGHRLVSYVGLCVAGAVSSNMVQVALARVFVFGAGARYMAPAFLALGLASGLGLGAFAQVFARRSRWLAGLYDASAPGDAPPRGVGAGIEAYGTDDAEPVGAGSSTTPRKRKAASPGQIARRERWERLFSPGRLALAGAAASLAVMLNPSLPGRCAVLALAVVAGWFSGRRLSPVTTLLVMVGIVGSNLLVPAGRALAAWGPFTVTETALLEGISKAVGFECLIFLSKASLLPGLRLPGRLGALFGDALATYGRILERAPRVRASNFMLDIDSALVSVYNRGDGESAGGADSRPDAAPAEPGPRGSNGGDRFLPLAPILAAAAFFL